MTDAFETMIAAYRARMTLLRETMERQGHLRAVSQRDPDYSILLTSNVSSEAPWRVTSFRDGQPIGHREYDRLEGGGPVQNAFQEFAGADMRLVPRKVIGERPAPPRRAYQP